MPEYRKRKMSDRDTNKILLSFRNYYKENISSLIVFARRFVSVEIAEDITQDLFLDIWNKYELNNELPTKSCLFASIRNKCLNTLTREKVKQNYIESAELDIKLLGLDYYKSQERRLIEKEDIQYIHDEIEKLPDRCREIFKMSYLEEMKNIEIAKKLNISVRTVEHHLYLGLRTLRDRLTGDGKKSLFFLFFL